MKQASMFDRFSFGAFAFQQDRLTPAEVDVRQGQIVDTLMLSAVVVVLDEAPDLRFEVA